MSEPETLFAIEGRTGCITLNRPRALNALTLGMAGAIDRQLAAWAGDAAIDRVLIEGAGGRAFCAGGDVVAVAKAGLAGEPLTREMFVAEYAMNRTIHRFPKPYLALMDGITMGGGCGLSVHGSLRIVTERTLLAMPETGIGFFTDIGASWFLPRCPGLTGLYLGLTGARIGAADAIWSGLATHFVPSDRLGDLRAAIAGSSSPDETIAEFSTDPGPSDLAGRQPIIDRCFGAGSVEGILAALAADADPLGQEIADGMARLSPTSLKVTHRLLTMLRNPTIEEALHWEFRVAQGCMAGHDFYEGIRALLIDKDNAPAWKPASLEEVTRERVEAHFSEPDGGDLPLPEIN